MDALVLNIYYSDFVADFSGNSDILSQSSSYVNNFFQFFHPKYKTFEVELYNITQFAPLSTNISKIFQQNISAILPHNPVGFKIDKVGKYVLDFSTIIQGIKKEISIAQDFLFLIPFGSETEKEGFEPSRRLPDLHP